MLKIEAKRRDKALRGILKELERFMESEENLPASSVSSPSRSVTCGKRRLLSREACRGRAMLKTLRLGHFKPVQGVVCFVLELS
jgi:hypothetical protein